MELAVLERWQHTPEVEVFYDVWERRVTFKKHQFMYSLRMHDLVANPYIDLQTFKCLLYSFRFQAAVLNSTEKVLAFKRTQCDMVRPMQEFLAIEDMKHHVIKGGSQRDILGFHWIAQSPFCDFVMVHSTGLDLYKLPQSGGVKMQHMRNYSVSLSYYWVEPVSGLLVVAVSNKPGTLQTYFLKQLLGPKAFEGPRFSLQLVSPPDSWTSRHSNVSNLSLISQSPQEPDLHTITVVKLYDTPYILHVDSRQGKVTIYRVVYEEVKPMFAVRLSPGGYDVREWDNVLILQSQARQESHVVDVKREEGGVLKPFCSLSHKEFNSDTRVSVSFQFIRCAKDFELRLGISYSNHKLTQSGVSELSSLETECPLTPALTYVDSNVAVDMRKGICYRLELVLRDVAAAHPNRLESVKFLLRRWGCKELALAYLRKAILEGVSLLALGDFFQGLNLTYKSAAIERKGSSSSNSSSRKSMPSSPQDTNSSTPRRSLITSSPEIKTENGETVILQAEMNSLVFLPALEDFSVDPEYLAFVVIEYQRSLINHDIQVHQYIQLLCAKLLIRTGNFSVLHSLIQFQVLLDSKELATMLLAIANGSGLMTYPPALQLALDMLARLNLFEEIVEELLDRKMLHEAAICMRTNQLSEESVGRLKNLATGSEFEHVCCSPKAS